MNDMTKMKPKGLELLRAPFPANQISKLPKPYKADSQKGKCSECGGYHGLPAMHLDYVGHAALTDRLLDCDPLWTWEPVAFGPDGLPAMDKIGGMWIKLTVCGVTRLGYGHPDGKSGGNAVKEVIGDALRNAAMRFGAALDLWHKGDLHGDDDPVPETPRPEPKKAEEPRDPVKVADGLIAAFDKAQTPEDLDAGKADGTKVAQAWDWLSANHKAEADRVSKAFAERHKTLSEIPY